MVTWATARVRSRYTLSTPAAFERKRSIPVRSHSVVTVLEADLKHRAAPRTPARDDGGDVVPSLSLPAFSGVPMYGGAQPATVPYAARGWRSHAPRPRRVHSACPPRARSGTAPRPRCRSEEHTSELQSRVELV